MEYSEGVWEQLSKMDPLWQHKQMLMPDFWKKGEEAFQRYLEEVRIQQEANFKAVEWWKTQDPRNIVTIKEAE